MANLKLKFNYYYIYKIVNLINKKCYVGFHATNIEYDNYFGSGKLLNEAIVKYGRPNFIMGIIEYVDINNWKEKETYWIKQMKAHVSLGGYNLTWGGDGTLGLKMSNESKEKIKKVTTGVKQSEESKKRKSDKLKGIKFTKEHKEKIRISLTGKCLSEETKIKIGNTNRGKQPRLGKHHMEETKQLLRMKSKINTVGEKNGMFGKKHSDETRQKMRNAKKGKILNQHK